MATRGPAEGRRDYVVYSTMIFVGGLLEAEAVRFDWRYRSLYSFTFLFPFNLGGCKQLREKAFGWRLAGAGFYV